MYHRGVRVPKPFHDNAFWNTTVGTHTCEVMTEPVRTTVQESLLSLCTRKATCQRFEHITNQSSANGLRLQSSAPRTVKDKCIFPWQRTQHRLKVRVNWQ